MQSDSDAAQAFVSKLRRLETEGQATRQEATTYANVTINRPVRCTIVFGGAPHVEWRKPKEEKDK